MTSLPLHCNCMTHFRTEAKIKFFMISTKLLLSSQKSHFGFEVKMMLIENIQEFRSVGAWNVFFWRTVCMLVYKLPKWPDQGTTGQTRDLQTERSFSMIQVFRQSLEAVGLSQVCKMLRQLTGQIIAHYSSSKIRKTHLCLFRLDQGPHTTFSKIQKKKMFLPYSYFNRHWWKKQQNKKPLSPHCKVVCNFYNELHV